MRKIIIITALFALALLSGCSSTSKNTNDIDSQVSDDSSQPTDSDTQITDSQITDSQITDDSPIITDDSSPVTDADQLIELVAIPAGSFDMGDHNGYNDPKHSSDELPLHTVTLSAFSIAKSETTCTQYLAYLNSALKTGEIEVKDTAVVAKNGGDIYCDTSTATAPNCITWDGKSFGIVKGKEQHPMSGVRWIGAIAFSNWYSAQLGLKPCYTLADGSVNWTEKCVRLPTEAEWEYAGRGGQYDPYRAYPWGDETDDARVNWVGSNDPWEKGPQPLTTPVCFFDGSLRQRADYDWPDTVETYQTLDGQNGFGLCDMAGNVWEWVNDWYGKNYYFVSPEKDPTGAAAGDLMPDGLAYRNLRGGSFFNSTLYRGDHERVSNRDPAYFRGKYLDKDDPNGPWFHIGFRVVLQGAGTTPSDFTITSTAFTNGGTLPADYTCDGAGINPPIAWSGIPDGTVELALMMTTQANDGLKWNWVLYNIPVTVTSLAEKTSGVGTAGSNSDGGALAYAPPCSQGPGPKTYTFTIYALSGKPSFSVPAEKVNGDALTKAISGITKASAKIDVSYTRP